VVAEETDVQDGYTRYLWEQVDWTEEMILQQSEEEWQAVEALRSRGSASGGAAAPIATPSPREEGLTRVENGEQGRYWWRWGSGENCTIDGSGVTVWTEGPFGGESTSCTLEQFSAGNRSARRFLQRLPEGLRQEATEAARRLKGAPSEGS
jgi:hypothetical protein